MIAIYHPHPLSHHLHSLNTQRHFTPAISKSQSPFTLKSQSQPLQPHKNPLTVSHFQLHSTHIMQNASPNNRTGAGSWVQPPPPTSPLSLSGILPISRPPTTFTLTKPAQQQPLQPRRSRSPPTTRNLPCPILAMAAHGPFIFSPHRRRFSLDPTFLERHYAAEKVAGKEADQRLRGNTSASTMELHPAMEKMFTEAEMGRGGRAWVMRYDNGRAARVLYGFADEEEEEEYEEEEEAGEWAEGGGEEAGGRWD